MGSTGGGALASPSVVKVPWKEPLRAASRRVFRPKPTEHLCLRPLARSWLGTATMCFGVCPKLPSCKLGAEPPGHCGHLMGHLNSCWTGAILKLPRFPDMFKAPAPTHNPVTRAAASRGLQWALRSMWPNEWLASACKWAATYRGDGGVVPTGSGLEGHSCHTDLASPAPPILACPLQS